MANSGGGSLVVGVQNDGTPSGANCTPVLTIDPAKVVDKIAAYTGDRFANLFVLSAPILLPSGGRPTRTALSRCSSAPLALLPLAHTPVEITCRVSCPANARLTCL